MSRRVFRVAALVAALAASGAAAACPPMSAYRVTGVSADQVPIASALEMLFGGTAWTGVVNGQADDVRVSFRGVSGPLDQVLTKVLEGAGRASPASISSVSDTNRCITTVTVQQPVVAQAALPVAAAQDATPVPAAPARRGDVLAAGSNVSEAMAAYVERNGWTLRWLIDEDYVLDADLPIPAMDLIDGVTYVIRAYQAQGGMRGVSPRFARGNNVVVIEQMSVRETQR